MFEQSLSWLQTVTVGYIVLTVMIVVALGFVLQWLVRARFLQPEVALGIIETVSALMGLAFGAMGFLLLLVILKPDAANWIVNDLYAKTTIWQAQFQLWLAPHMEDPRIASAVGMLLGAVKVGNLIVGYVLGNFVKWVTSHVLQKRFHTNMLREDHAKDKIAELEAELKRLRSARSLRPVLKR